MNEKNCEYCGNEFHANRKDAKYCSKTCKNEAYLARKANGYSSIGRVEEPSNGVISSHNRRYGSTPLNLSRTSLDRILTSTSTNKEVLNHLLSQKDYTGDIRSEKSKLEIQLMFVQRDLDIATKKVEEQAAYIEKLEDKVEKSNSFMGRVMDICEANPVILASVASGIGGIMKKAQPQATSTVHGQSEPIPQKEQSNTEQTG